MESEEQNGHGVGYGFVMIMPGSIDFYMDNRDRLTDLVG